MDQSPGGAFHGVRLAKRDGDKEYCEAMTSEIAPWERRQPPPEKPASTVETFIVSLEGPTTIAYAMLTLDLAEDSDDQGEWHPLGANKAHKLAEKGMRVRAYRAETDEDVVQFVDMVEESQEEREAERIAEAERLAPEPPRRGLRYQMVLHWMVLRIMWMDAVGLVRRRLLRR